jgi:hypothetical protein
MIEDDAITDAFYAGRRSAAYPLALNDTVLVREGRKSGSLAAVISLQSMAPSVSYLVEHGDGSDDIVPLPALELKGSMEPNQTVAPPTPGGHGSP